MGALRILVIGCGSIGRRHIRLLYEMGVQVAGFDINREEAERYCAITPDIRDLQELRLGGAIVATPPNHHVSAAVACFEAGIPVMVEKPLAHTLENGQRIVAAAEQSGKTLLTGYNLRFHPGLRRVKQLLDVGSIGKPLHARIWCSSYLPDWRPGTDYREGYAAKRETGGGVLLDASHELDYACWLFGEPVSVSCVAQNTGALEIETEDVADLTVMFASGAQVSIHLSYLDRGYCRGCQIVGERSTLGWTTNGLRAYLTINDEQEERFTWRPDDMYRAELQHFLAVIRGEEQPLCTGEDGLLALKVALAARESSETGRVVVL